MPKSLPKAPASGQKNLFSFFSKKPKPSPSTSVQTKSPPSASSKASPQPSSNPPLSQLKLSSRLQVYWPIDEEWYNCTLTRILDEKKYRVKLTYEDGDVEVVSMGEQIWRFAAECGAGEKGQRGREKGQQGEKRGGESDDDEDEVVTSKNVAAKRRRIEESEDESFTMDDDDNDDDESFHCDVDKESDEESFHADEDEEEEETTPKPKKKAPVKTTKPKITILTPKQSNSQPRPISQTPHKAPRPTPANLSSKRLDPPLPLPGTVNPPGSHFHNHLTFFSNRIDLNGHPSTSPNHSIYNMKIDWNELERTSQKLGVSLSPAQKQWWEIKSSRADCVLLFKTGKFYEMFHDDADIAANVLGHQYMKGVIGHAGFPEGGYGNCIGKLVERGYRVARVEQTETPEGLRERKKGMKGKKPSVVCREVCGVVSRGTRTFCYLDSEQDLENDGTHSKGPLIVIKETLIHAMDTEEDSGAQAVCEYGITIVDPLTSAVTLGQFADGILRTRMLTLLASFSPSEILIEKGENGASSTLRGLIKSSCPTANVREIGMDDSFPVSSAVKEADRKAMDRPKKKVHPWSVEETMEELYRKNYYPRGSKNASTTDEKIARWPEVLKVCIEGEANLALSSFGATVFYLQSNLVDDEILSMGIVKAYIPPNSGDTANAPLAPDELQNVYQHQARENEGVNLVETQEDTAYTAEEATIDHLALDGTTLSNLEVLHNLSSGSSKGSLLSKIDYTNSPHGCRLLRAWLLRPLFIKAEIDRRADAVAELATGAAAMSMGEARNLLKKTGDIERLLSRVHSMGGGGNGASQSHHPDDRAIMYENEKHNKRKVGDFSKLLNGLKAAAHIPEKFDGVSITSPLLAKLVRTTNDGGCMPADLHEKLDWFFDNFDLKKAAKGEFEPAPGMSEDYDDACESIGNILRELDAFKSEVCSYLGHGAKSAFKYINTKEDSKDKYLIELPATIPVPDEFVVKGKRGKGNNQINKYRCPQVEGLVKDLERAIDIKNEGKAMGMKLVFAKFDSMREIWRSVTMATAMLDAIGSLATLAGQPGFCRPTIVDCPPNKKPGIKVIQGRHPCVEVTHTGGSFIPNDLTLGGHVDADDSGSSNEASILLLSGPNMGGKSTLLRQTCLITILAQMGSFVPAEECILTPVDRIFTRLGASDRILCGQSTFFVELAETAAAVRGATRRSLVIMDELGRGTSTFDGTAIASATVKHLVERSKCLTMFATHYHSLLEDWKNDKSIRLGHMECIVEDDSSDDAKNNITFLYTLGEGPCPKSFGVNVARLAGLPDDVLRRAKNISTTFEAEMNGEENHHKIIPCTARSLVTSVQSCYSGRRFTSLDQLRELWESLQ